MTVTRVAAWSCGVALVAVWLAAAAGTRQDASALTGDAPGPSPASVGPLPDDGAQSARLRHYVQEAPSPHRPSRNLFAFVMPPVPSRDEPRPASTPTPPEVTPPTAPEFGLSVIGIATEQTPDGLERTAILSGQGRLLLVKAGDEVTPHIRVVLVEVGAVVLEDVTAGSQLRLELP